MARSGSGGTRSGRATASRGSAPTRKAAPKKGGQKRAGQERARKPADVEAKTVAEFRDALRKNLIRPLELVMLSRERIEEVLGEAVEQGRVTARDAQRISSGLVKRGEKQTRDVLGDLEQLLGRVSRSAGVGSSFPILRYDDLNASQIQSHLGSLTPAQLRKVRDYERRNANRKTVLNAIETKLR